VMLALLSLALIAPAMAVDNGLGLTPPMGWRSWNLYQANVNQSLITSVMDHMVARTRLVDGRPTSLCDLGYCDVGLDDNWQVCGSSPNSKFTFHDEDGNPVVNTNLFPDFKAMTDYAHSLKLTAGWYLNNCICKDHCSDLKCYQGDVLALRKYGFDAVKLDGCSAQMDLDVWYNLLNVTGAPVMIENCHWGLTLPTDTWCPFNFYRSSGDIFPNFNSIMNNLMTVIPLANKGLSRPGCWAYPDMLEVGCGGSGLTFAETRSHFGAWCIVSSPLTLSHDLGDDKVVDTIWPLIANVEAIAVNQAYFGNSGTTFTSSAVEEEETVVFATETSSVEVASKLYFYKPMSNDGSKVAVLLFNTGSTTSDLKFAFKDVPGFTAGSGKVKVRDIWARSDIGSFTSTFTSKGVVSHDAAFLMLSRDTSTPQDMTAME
jgi:alpha-galactosidase